MIRSTHGLQIRDEIGKSCLWILGGTMELVRFVLPFVPPPVFVEFFLCSLNFFLPVFVEVSEFQFFYVLFQS
jgi:hypothetical protein